MLPTFTPDRRRVIALRAGVREQYLYQILRGLGVPAPALTRKLNLIEPKLRIQDLRPNDWREIWPELEEVETLRAQVAQLMERLRRYEPNPSPSLAPQAPAATNPEAKEDVHG